MTQIYQIGFDRTTYTEQHIRDAQNADDWPEDELQTVEVEPDEITVEGTPEGMRWLYDYFHHLKRAWRLEGEQTDATGTSSASSLSVLARLGVGVGGIFVTALLAYLLAYLQVLGASRRDRRRLRTLLVAVSVPLAFAFAGIVAFESLRIIGLL